MKLLCSLIYLLTIVISLHGIGNRNRNHNNLNDNNNNNNFIQRIFNNMRIKQQSNNNNNDDNNGYNNHNIIGSSKDDILDININAKAMSELSIILIEKFVSFSLFYLSFKLVTSTLSTSLKKLLEIINEVKDPSSSSSSSSSTSMNIVPSYIMKFLKPNITLNSYELELLNTMIDPSRIDTTIYDIGGLDNVKRTIFNLFNNNTSINSISSSSSSSSSKTLYRPVKSVLLYGPPGCG